MFGELDDSDIYVNNQNDNFDETLINEPVEDEALLHDSEESPEESAPVPNDGESAPQQPKSDSKKLLLYVLVLVLLVAGAAGAYFYKMKASQQDEVAVDVQQTSEMGDFFYDKAKDGAQGEQTTVVDVDLAAVQPQAAQPQSAQPAAQAEPDVAPAQAAKTAENEIAPVVAAKEKEKKELEKKKQLAQKQNKQVVIPVTNGGRANPFVPYDSALANAKPPEFDLIAPPLDIPEADPLTDSLMSTKISGIMYDSQRPSAIINFGGSDHLVHKGDRVQGYQIIDITKDRVVLKYGTNIYRATVGQEVAGGNGVTFNEVSNLNRQFGGAYSKAPCNVIEINGSN